MADLDLRPLTLGEILDRTFSLYRKHFLLFAGITAIPNLLILALNLAQMLLMPLPRLPAGFPPDQFQGLPLGVGSGIAVLLVSGLLGLVVYMVAYLFAQGGTVFAVSEFYLGRNTTIGASLGRMRGQLLSLFGVVFLSGLATGVAFLLLIVPGIYVACRLIACIPAALLEDLGPVNAMERSFALTKDFASRAFLIYLLYFALIYGAALLFSFPFTMAALFFTRHPDTMRILLALGTVGQFLARVLVSPVLTIATAVFYYDLRVRKEAFDLQVMLNPTGVGTTGPSIIPRTLY